jgi:3-hydroxyacyl-CoA dehydrogenase
MSDVVEYEIHGAIALIALNSPPVNAMGVKVRQGITDAVAQAENNPDISAIVVLGRGRCFCGGADIREFGKPRLHPYLGDIIDNLEACQKPVIAAIHKTAIGGGCELALGCHYRVGDASASFGLPEIKLGLLPGAGGTQRLPRLIGIKAALDVILSGEFVDAQKAKDLGFLDEVISGDLAQGAIDFANRLIAEGQGVRPVRSMTIDSNGATEIFANARKKVTRRARGLIAPERCIAAVESAVQNSLEDGLALERTYFDELVQSDQSYAQRHLFFAQRQAHRVPGVAVDTKLREIRSAAVIGCGTMGRGITLALANGGVPVTVLEVSEQALDTGLRLAQETYAGSVKRGSLSTSEMEARLKRISGTTDYNAIAEADIVIEAVFEDMALKKQIFSRLDEVCKPGAILATNTSSLDINEIAALTNRPGDVIGTHFFSPANVMRLMENVRGNETSDDVIATVMKLSKTINKVGVMVGVCDGFVGNRMLYVYRSQAEFLLEEGALPHQIDKVIYDFGFPMGPFAMGDLAGLDVGYQVRQHRRKTRPSNDRYSFIADRIVESGRLGQKNNKGWYLYDEGSRTPKPDPEIEELIVGISAELGITRREISDEEILERCMYPLINEGAKILGETIASRPGDIDLIWVYGYGFPIGRGGPMFYADSIGTKTIYETMKKLYNQHGDMLEPAPLLEELAKSGKSFADWQMQETK